MLTLLQKGRILYLLSKYSLSLWWEDILDLDWNHENEVLALRLIEKGIKTKRDYQETISHRVDFEATSSRISNSSGYPSPLNCKGTERMVFTFAVTSSPLIPFYRQIYSQV